MTSTAGSVGDIYGPQLGLIVKLNLSFSKLFAFSSKQNLFNIQQDKFLYRNLFSLF